MGESDITMSSDANGGKNESEDETDWKEEPTDGVKAECRKDKIDEEEQPDMATYSDGDGE